MLYDSSLWSFYSKLGSLVTHVLPLHDQAANSFLVFFFCIYFFGVFIRKAFFLFIAKMSKEVDQVSQLLEKTTMSESNSSSESLHKRF